MLGADDGGEFRRRAEFGDLEADGERMVAEQRGRDRNAELVARPERALVVGLAAGNGDDDAVSAEQVGKLHAGSGERLFVGFVTDGERAGEVDDAGGVGVGEADGAGVDERHSGILSFRFWIFDFIREA